MALKFNKDKFRKDLVVKRVLDLNQTQEEVAKATNLGVTQIASIEKGEDISMQQFIAICNYTECKRPGGYFIQEEEVVLSNDDEQTETDKEGTDNEK